MGLDHIVCLANSYKHDHRCVAGISLDTKKWVRLVGKKVAHCLTRSEARYADGKEVSLLDVFEVELDVECASRYHPEDVSIAERPWRFMRRFSENADFELLAAAVSMEPIVLQGYCDRVDCRKLKETPAKVSLGLVRPEDLWWWIREENGKRRFRSNFRLGHEGRIRYDLPVTDPVWLDQLHLLPTGIHPHATVCGTRTVNTLLTASLSEPFEGFHYKLIAGVINLPV